MLGSIELAGSSARCPQSSVPVIRAPFILVNGVPLMVLEDVITLPDVSATKKERVRRSISKEI